METSLDPLSPRPFHFNRARLHHNLWNMPTESQAIKLYKLSKSGQLTPQLFQTLCSHWEVSENTLWNILNRKTWKAFPLESLAFPPEDVQPTPSYDSNP